MTCLSQITDKSRNCYFLNQGVIMCTVETLRSGFGEHDIRPFKKKNNDSRQLTVIFAGTFYEIKRH